MIQLESVRKSYRIGTVTRTILHSVSLEIPSDRRVAVLGPTGAGKTVFVRLLCGLEAPTEGVISRYTNMSFPVGYTKALKYNLSAMQNVAFAARVYGADVGEVSDFVSRTTGLGVLLEEPLRRLSVIDRGMVSFALGYGLPFDTYLLDHAVAYGTTEFRSKCLAMLDARAQDAGIILATRHRRTAERICDCGIVIDQGNVDFYDDIGLALAAFDNLQGAAEARADMSRLEQELED